MSDAVGKKITLWDSTIEYDELIPDGKTEAVKAAVEAGLTAFDRHQEALLTILRSNHERGPGAEPFDANRSWRGLTSLAGTYFWKARVKKEVIPAADLVARLRELKKAFGKARAMADKAMPDDVGGALCSSWWEGTREYAEAEGRFVDLLYIEREFKKVVTSLAALETAATRAENDVRMRRGRPQGTSILPREYIEALAAQYRDATGSKPGAGDGPFAKFVMVFLTALGRGNIKYESVIDAIKDARKHLLQNPRAWEPSPFDEVPLPDKAMLDVVGNDFGSWHEVTSEEVEANGHFVELLDIERTLGKMTTSPGGGSFARFVMEFLIELDRRKIEYESVIDAIKDARDGPFAGFGIAFQAALRRRKIEYDGVIDAVKDARARSLQNRGEPGPSPLGG